MNIIVTIVIVTFRRPSEIRQTIAALQKYLQYPMTNIRWVIADDGSGDDYIMGLKSDFASLPMTFSVCPRGGWGRNVNKAIATIKTNYFFMCEDDYVATRPIELDKAIALLRADKSIGMVRLDGVSGHKLNLELRECTTETGQLDYCRISKNSPGLNVYSNRPHVCSMQFMNSYGKYLEGRALGETEDNYSYRVKEREGPDVVILADGIRRSFVHIGKSYQGTEYDNAGK